MIGIYPDCDGDGCTRTRRRGARLRYGSRGVFLIGLRNLTVDGDIGGADHAGRLARVGGTADLGVRVVHGDHDGKRSGAAESIVGEVAPIPLAGDLLDEV